MVIEEEIEHRNNRAKPRVRDAQIEGRLKIEHRNNRAKRQQGFRYILIICT